jgi:hypothetical protein
MDTIAKPTTGSKQSARPDQSTAAHGGPSPGRPGHILRPACVGASTRRLAPGLGDQTGLWSIGEYCHRNPLARESVTIKAALVAGPHPGMADVADRNADHRHCWSLDPMPRQWGCPKEPTLGSPLGGYAVRPPLTPSLNLNSAIVRTTTFRGSGCAPPMRIRGGLPDHGIIEGCRSAGGNRSRFPEI